MKKVFFVLFLTFICMPVYAQYTGQLIGPDVSQLDGKELKWEAGSFDHFVMFKSLMTNNNRVQCDTNPDPSVGCDLPGNPESDTCLTESTFKLKEGVIPSDAYIERAFLVWSTSIDPNSAMAPTDNQATISFASADGTITDSISVTAPRQGVAGTESNPGQQDFTFEGVAIENAGTIVGGYYTYRVDVTDWFVGIHTKGREAGVLEDGYSLVGDYTVSDVTCTNDPQYISQVANGSIYSSTVVAGWSVILVYRSQRISPKMVYIYNGFGQYVGQNQDVAVSGFEFPDKPAVKVTFHVNEGDPGFAYSTGCGSMGMAACPPEGLQVTGATTPPESLVILQNDCNPAKFQDSNGQPFNYSETYNSISSMYSWDASVPDCVGGDPNNPNADELEYTMDIDTFLLDAEVNPDIEAQFKKGDTQMFFKLGANRDVVYTNYMVVSVDTKAPRYDIPPNADTPSGREKIHCGCSTESDAVCFTSPFYFAIKVQNWGDDISTNVTVQDNLSPKVNYVAGTTEMCKEWKSANVCSKWEKIEDGSGGAFPLEQPYKIADALAYCDQATFECPETIMIRFKVLPSDILQKHDVIENTALINDDSGKVYRSNTSIPLRLVSGSCPSASECENPDLTECGGIAGEEECTKDEDCEDGEVCNENGNCVTDTSKLTTAAKITIAEGKNSPVNSSSIIIPAPSTGLIMGQFSIKADGSVDDDKYFNFKSVTVSVNREGDVNFSNIKLVYDADGDGKVSEGEAVIAEPMGEDAGTIAFAVKTGNQLYKAGVLNHFLMVLDATYKTLEDIPLNTAFNFDVEGAVSFDIKDAGDPEVTVSGAPISFVEYAFEPTRQSFVFTKGAVDPAVPEMKDLNKSVAVIQIRSKAVSHANSLEKIRVKTTTQSVRFGEGIKEVKLYLDTEGDGFYVGNELLGSVVTSDAANTAMLELYSPLSYAENEEKTLLIVCDFNIPKDKMAQIEVSSGKVYLDESVDILGLPLKSKEFWYRCEEGDLTCGVVEDEPGCSLTTVETSGYEGLLFALAALAMALVFRKKRTSK